MKRRRIDSKWVTAIDDHIKSFPTKKTHYQSNVKEYLDEKLTVKVMFNLFREKHPDSTVKYKFFLKHFNENFGLSFGRPQVDTCGTCEEMNTKLTNRFLSEGARSEIEREKVAHQIQAKQFHEAMQQCKKNLNETEGAIVFDYMQNLCLPYIPVQESFYYSKITVNVFAVHNLKNKHVMFYLYDETIAKKGSNEVCTFVKDYIFNYILPDKKIKTLLMFSDNCGGQNKNQMMLSLCLALCDLGLFEHVKHYYPIRGHSYNPCDQDFNTAKRLIRKMDRIYTLKQFAELIIGGSAAGNFQLTMVNSEMILDFKNWTQINYKKTGVTASIETRNKPRNEKVFLQVQKYHYFQFMATTPGVVVSKIFISDAMVYTFNLRKLEVTGWPTQVYDSPLAIKKSKRSNLLKLLKYIPTEHLNTYTDFLEAPVVEERDSEQEDDE